jgi:hypothetical protein
MVVNYNCEILKYSGIFCELFGEAYAHSPIKNSRYSKSLNEKTIFKYVVLYRGISVDCYSRRTWSSRPKEILFILAVVALKHLLII